MRKLIILLVLVASVSCLNAQQLQPLVNLQSDSGLYKLPQPQTKLQSDLWNPLPKINSDLAAINQNLLNNPATVMAFNSKMPVVVLDGNSKMPILKIEGYYYMPVKKLGAKEIKPALQNPIEKPSSKGIVR